MRIFGFLLLLFPFSFCFSQIINTERLRVNSDKEGWAGTISLSFEAIENVRSIMRGGILGGLEYQKNKTRFLILGNYRLGRLNGVNNIDQGYGHVRYNRDLGKHWVAEAFTQLQVNSIQLLRARALTGAGPRFRIAESDTFRCFVGSLYMFEYEELNDSLGTINRDHRQSSYLNLGFSLGENARIDHVTYYQPNWQQFSDFRLSTETRLQVNITEKLAFRTSFYLLYDSRPPETLPTTYYTWTNSFSLGL